MSIFSTIWDVVWTFFWIFAFIAYLIALFSIVTDLFRDTKLGGWAKAIWLVFLFSLPFLTALVYLIARGDGMANLLPTHRKRKAVSNDQNLWMALGGVT